MKQRFSSHTTLIELTAALLFLTLTSVTILGLFTTAHGHSRAAQENAAALRLARECAALISGADDVHEALASGGFEQTGDGVYVRQDAGMTLSAALEEEQTEVGILTRAAIRVEHAGELLMEMPAARYINKEVIDIEAE